MAWRLTQNSALVPKKRANSNAVSAVTERSPLTIAPIRVASTHRAMAREFTYKLNGLRNSSPSTSPRWVVTRFGVAALSVVVNDFDMLRPLPGPSRFDIRSRASECPRALVQGTVGTLPARDTATFDTNVLISPRSARLRENAPDSVANLRIMTAPEIARGRIAPGLTNRCDHRIG